MGGFVAAIQPYFERYGYPILFLTVFIESFGIPAPGQTFLVTAALLAATGKFSLWGVLATAFLAAVIGDSLGYLLGAHFGRRLLLRFGHHVGLDQHRLLKLSRQFDRHGAWFVTIARMFDVLRQINGILAGSMKMRYYRFLFFNALGAALWVSLWGFGAFYLGRGLRRWLSHAGSVAMPIVLAVLGVALVVLVWWIVHHRRKLHRA